MSSISAWVLAVAGVCVMGVLVELMLPSGQTKKYVKGVFAFIVVLVVISPLPKFLGKNYTAEDIFEENAIVIQEDFVYQINRDRLEKIEEMVEEDLILEGINNVQIKINANIFTTDMKIDAVFVDLSGLVISENKQHIDIKETIVKSISKYISIDKKDIVFD